MKLLSVLVSLIFISCSTTPKGDYSRTKIERPYSLPDDVAQTSFGISTISEKITDADESIEEDDYDSYGSFLLYFENGIGEDVSWVFPLGIKYSAYSDEKHTVGLTAFTLFLYNYASLDYWYRVNKEISLRPYYRHTSFDIGFTEDKRNFYGLEFLYQTTSNLALGLDFSSGKYTTSSDLLEGFFGLSASEVSGNFTRLGLIGLYSLSEKWDIEWKLYTQDQQADNADLETSTAELQFNYFY